MARGRLTIGCMPCMRALHAVACALLVAFVLTVMVGCRVSDALTEVIYDQTADIIDYDNPTKIYVNDSTAQEESDQFSAREVSEDADVASDTVQNLVVYSSNPNTEGFTAKKSVFSETPDFRGIEASEEVCFVQSDDPNAFDHPLTVEPDDPDPEEDEQQDEPVTQVASTDSGDSSTTSPAPSVEQPEQPTDQGGGTGEAMAEPDEWQDVAPPPPEDTTQPAPAETGTQPTAPPEDAPTPAPTESGGGNGDGETQVPYDAANPTAEPPKVEKIAAFGQAAALVAMVGGPGALAAVDSETYAGKFGQQVCDLSGVAVAWSGDGADPAQLNVDVLVAAAEALETGKLVVATYSGAYFSQLSEADQRKLADAGIEQYVLYPLTCTSNILRDVTVIGESLAESTSVNYFGQTEARAAQYIAFHNSLLEACGKPAGARAYESRSTLSDKDFDKSPATRTLLIDAYDPGAQYTGSEFDLATGLACASAGWSTSPVSYYIQVGGLVNAAAEQSNENESGELAVWQFHKNKFPFNAGEWTGELARNARQTDGLSLLTSDVNVDFLGYGNSFGSSSFPKIIVTSQAIKDGILANSAYSNGAYHPYDWDLVTGAFTYLRSPDGIETCLGYDTSYSGNCFGSGQIDADALVVNPRGLISEWTQGSVESFLEAAWVNDVVNEAPESLVGWQADVQMFYSTFFGYELTPSDWDYIMAGA